MTPSELSKLKSLAEAVIATSSVYYHDAKVCDVEEVNDYLFATDPQVILELIVQIEELQMANHILTDHRMRSLCIDFYALDDEGKKIVLDTMSYINRRNRGV